ncbi:MAG: multicopper oxidase family protein [Chloroflexi bacterium]|nr:multicopper oxidase family protein [Chloroflexota bacterium]
MKTIKLFSNFVTTGMRLFVLTALIIVVIGHTTSAAAAAIPVELCAKPGSVLMADGATVTFWGYGIPTTSGDCSTATASLPGPQIYVDEGDVVTVTLYNGLTEATSMLFPGQTMTPDLTGVIAGGSTSYTFTASAPGTYLYEAGLLNNAEHQVAMGLYGALIVRSTTPGQAYTSASTAYNDEAVLVLSEIDQALNNSANPAAFDMREYHPNYWLINGKSYPQTVPTPTAAGNRVLVRYLNAGFQTHSMGVLGLSQNVIAIDGNPLTYSRFSVTESIAPGRTMDVITTIPVSATSGSMFALYEANFLQHNNNAAGFGGMLTFLTLGAPVPVAGGPLTSGVTLTPNITNGSSNVALAATTTGTTNITAAEYYIDSISGAATPMNASDLSFDSLAENIEATITTVDLAALSAGSHTIYVRGQDSNGWGAFSSAVLNLDKAGPVTSAGTLLPNPSNGTVDLTLSATANDSANGNGIISAAEYSIDGGTTSPMTVISPTAVISSVKATVPAATINALSDGSHDVNVRSQDALGNWGNPLTINFIVDHAGPVTSAVLASPSPNNGTLPFNASTPAVHVTATMMDPLSNVIAAEGFIDTVGANGTGFPFIAIDGVFNSLSEAGYANIPLATISNLSNGPHNIHVHSKDAAGNWGTTSFAVIIVDKMRPFVNGLTLTPPASNNTSVVINATANDVVTGNNIIVKGEYFIDALGVAGTGTLMTRAAASPSTTISATIPAATITALAAGNHTIYVRTLDTAGNWSLAANTTLLIDRTAPTFTSITVSPNSILTGTTSTGLTVNGSNDPLVSGLASGVTGGEYWFGSTNITAGTGNAFSGTSTNIDTSTLAAGTYTVRVRIRDGAGNWSTGTNGVRTATLTVIPDSIFSDGFESPTTLPGNWTTRSTAALSRLNNTTTAALFGLRGLQAQGDNTNYLQYEFNTAANPAAANVDVRFYFNPNGNMGTNQDIFVARTSSNTVFRVRYRMNGAQPQVQIQVGTSTANTTWTDITDGVSNRIEVVWQSGSTLQLFVGGSLVADQSLAATNTLVRVFRFGSVTSGGSSTLEYFDAFSAKRSTTPYGP